MLAGAGGARRIQLRENENVVGQEPGPFPPWPEPLPRAPIIPPPLPQVMGNQQPPLARHALFRQRDAILRPGRGRGRLLRQASASSSPPDELDGVGGALTTSNVSVDGQVVSYCAPESHPVAAHGPVGIFIGDRPLTASRPFFEVTILDKCSMRPERAAGGSGASSSLGIVIGLCLARYPPDLLPGWGSGSVGYHCGEGTVFVGRPRGVAFGPVCDVGDRVGCGVRWTQPPSSGKSQGLVYFTKNGREVGPPLGVLPAEEIGNFFPAIGLQYPGEEVNVRQGLSSFGSSCQSDEDAMAVDGGEDEWLRLHDIKLSGPTLEYVGRGNSLGDVGLAQAKMAVGTRNHYFEIEIVDPGER